MGINRDSRHKRRLTGGRMPIHQKKRAFEKARPVSNTKLVSDVQELEESESEEETTNIEPLDLEKEISTGPLKL